MRRLPIAEIQCGTCQKRSDSIIVQTKRSIVHECRTSVRRNIIHHGSGSPDRIAGKKDARLLKVMSDESRHL